MKPSAIRALRRRHGWTQADLAARLGTDPVTVSRWERGLVTPRPSARARLAELRDVFPASLSAIVRLLGRDDVARVLRRERLLRHRPRRVRFAVAPSERIREVEDATRAQLALKAATR